VTAKRISSVWMSLPFWRTGTVEQRRMVADAIAGAKREATACRDAVMRHPDIAQRLVTRIGYKRVDQWHGYVPPVRDCNGAINTSPVRRELVSMLHDVAEREAAR
jgi:hypothetical protein